MTDSRSSSPANGLSPNVDVETHRRRLRQGVYPRKVAPVIEHFLDENERLREAAQAVLNDGVEVKDGLLLSDPANVLRLRSALEGGNG